MKPSEKTMKTGKNSKKGKPATGSSVAAQKKGFFLTTIDIIADTPDLSYFVSEMASHKPSENPEEKINAYWKKMQNATSKQEAMKYAGGISGLAKVASSVQQENGRVGTPGDTSHIRSLESSLYGYVKSFDTKNEEERNARLNDVKKDFATIFKPLLPEKPNLSVTQEPVKKKDNGIFGALAPKPPFNESLTEKKRGGY